MKNLFSGDDLDSPKFLAAREAMVENQIIRRGISDQNVISAMLSVPRHLFVPPGERSYAYVDSPLPIGHGATISQPFIVGLMTELLELTPRDRVLEIGTGSGYQAALLAEISSEVISLERVPELAAFAEKNLENLKIKNVRIIVCDGTGYIGNLGRFDAIIVTAASPKIPYYLVDILNEGGRLVVPVGDYLQQELLKVKIKDKKPVLTWHGGVRFVPLVGKEGWDSLD
ncbi:protein-L-isoaspartate(D-aspartate) O-methyltransferase [Methanoplanus sp. FWC-SCC4]|uniref:Protein-L-isoaspartate O-methyltransferase n=1 Tax=Methanochimaera problematica TaxID=2609417 RepID=A0AA97I3D4_9EURY|nr:protein-L-isoaspartate(D-aspartate) O-methyltransferase [Methanoplanus sp. FWC-SCC4]WOF16588.1 protein-L-isoaspartate(D-aspartate) O-methyltransferase [Methanoplanus sp. FWC-SCC4]